jgi:hypothetical protein
MSDINVITKDTDLSQVSMRKLDWDVEIYDKSYDVYRIEGYIHSIGGHWGENDYWCCPSDEKPTVDNLIQFGGHVVQWGIEYIPKNYTKTKWGDTEVRESGRVLIKRNGKPFYNIRSYKPEYGLAKGQAALIEIKEHPINFHSRNFREEIKGRKIWYENQPAIIERIVESNDYGVEIWVVPDKKHIEKFRFPTWENTDEAGWIEEYENGCRCDILESNIDWFRN